ncbi:uncharacterized protein ASPGLDRAFT_58143 [Aspergillus glaucus CBS 516.65]|uniref:Uncharacterized protein n=1 Tax=Aspergillus glaucus CBS 516.65 TaxID=1160497 RepID=A0A1L9VIG6_ASPGL|nr:hypothetical protein ASPGLDRAFT_58143 [Aspergillus glaucus CBS 516.65]OJJ83690.1 hypothetical protein ASPGLDRAFT_58143 [Aspergillus glaucus CBS 516.65]
MTPDPKLAITPQNELSINSIGCREDLAIMIGDVAIHLSAIENGDPKTTFDYSSRPAFYAIPVDRSQLTEKTQSSASADPGLSIRSAPSLLLGPERPQSTSMRSPTRGLSSPPSDFDEEYEQAYPDIEHVEGRDEGGEKDEDEQLCGCARIPAAFTRDIASGRQPNGAATAAYLRRAANLLQDL